MPEAYFFRVLPTHARLSAKCELLALHKKVRFFESLFLPLTTSPLQKILFNYNKGTHKHSYTRRKSSDEIQIVENKSLKLCYIYIKYL